MAKRLVWIDWMKVIGIYFIIAGHMFSYGHDFLYTFSVPLFFMISGFLSHHEDNVTHFWKKLFNNLVLPCLLICLIILFVETLAKLALGKFEFRLIIYRIFNIVTGMQGQGVYGGGLGMCWFIYTLVICKIISQFSYNKHIVQSIILLICIIIAVYYNMRGEIVYNSILNVTLAYPFFYVGGVYNNQFWKNIKIKNYQYGLIAVLGGIAIVLITMNNGSVRMYCAQYGNNVLLFFLGGLIGTIVVYAICQILSKYNPNVLSLLSRGMIIILGFHIFFLIAYKIVLREYRNTIIDYTVSLLILIAFIPIIWIVEKRMPILMGMRVKKTYVK